MDKTDERTEMIIKLVEGIIDHSHRCVQDLNYSDMTEQQAAEFKEADRKYKELQDKLSEELAPELSDLFMEYIDAETNVLALCESYMYRRGVINGLTNLQFIRESIGSNVLLLE